MRNNLLKKVMLATACVGFVVSCGKKDSDDPAPVVAPTPNSVAPQPQDQQIQVQGSELLNNPQGRGQITFSFPGADSYGCSMSQPGSTTPAQESACAGSLAVDMPSLKQTHAPGKWQLVIKAKKGQQILSTRSFDFCNGDCGTSTNQPAPAPVTSRGVKVGVFGIEGTPEFTVRQLVTVDSVSLGIKSYEQTNSQRCGGRSGAETISFAGMAAGNYCGNIYSNDAWFKIISGSKLAFNSIIINSSPAAIAQNSGSEKRIVVNSFDSRYEFNQTKSRFQFLCQQNNGGVDIVISPQVPVAQGFFGWNASWAQVPTCTHVDDERQVWRVGVAYILNDQMINVGQFGTYDQFCKNYNFTSRTITEVVYMEKVNGNNFDAPRLVRQMSDVLTKMLRKDLP